MDMSRSDYKDRGYNGGRRVQKKWKDRGNCAGIRRYNEHQGWETDFGEWVGYVSGVIRLFLWHGMFCA